MVDQPTSPEADEEQVKRRSRHLRGTIVEGLGDPITGSVGDADRQILKFHGTYLQDDRDLRAERQQQKLEPAYEFMVRVRIAAGVLSTAQWLALDGVAESWGNHTMRLTTRQAIQLHGISKPRLAPVMARIQETLLTTFGACGDVNRNVMSGANPFWSPAHRAVRDAAEAVSRDLLPSTPAYSEIWLGGEPVKEIPGLPSGNVEPLYGDTYLPRKFKVGFAVPPVNDVDVLTHDVGFIACLEDGRLVGYTVVVGGGMGMRYGDSTTYPQLARPLGFCPPEGVVATARTLMAIQRDYGNRSERHHARFKYTVDRMGWEALQTEVRHRLGWALGPPRAYAFTTNGDALGWTEGPDGSLHLGIHVPSGRVAGAVRAGLRALIEAHGGAVCLTANQNLILARVDPSRRPLLDRILTRYDGLTRPSALRQGALACVGLPTCGLAMAESERYLPTLLDQVEARWVQAGLEGEPLTLRVTGCPNGCARPYVAEVGLTGRAPGRYDLYAGGNAAGTRLAVPCAQNLDEAAVLDTMGRWFAEYAVGRLPGERLGDYLVRRGVVAEVTDGRRFYGSSAPAG